VLLSTEEGSRTIIEIKLTESTFGAARANPSHLDKLTRIYMPRLGGRVSEACLDPATFFRDYQLYRNLFQIRPATADRVVLLLPRARTLLWQHVSSWCSSHALGSLRDCVRVVTLEDFVSALATDTKGSKTRTLAITEIGPEVHGACWLTNAGGRARRKRSG